jgi:arylsulfatase A-like enzyme
MSDLPDIILSSVTGGLDVESLTRQFAVSRTEDSQQIAVRGKRWKYIYSDDEELYDLRKDPNEEVECASEHPKILKTLRNAKNEYIADLPAPDSGNSVAAGDDMREHLESLGYLSE